MRPLTLRHALGERASLGAVFNRGPLSIGGDGDTVAQASPDPADPTSGTTVAIASLRMVIDVGDWERCRWVLPGGQSGNPFSPHYDDQLALWLEGDALPIQWSEAAVAGGAAVAPLVVAASLSIDDAPCTGTGGGFATFVFGLYLNAA